MALSSASAGARGAPPRAAALLLFLDAAQPVFASLPDTSLGILSASQGRYSSAQLALDIGQGARVATSEYASAEPAPLALTLAGGSGGYIDGWSGALRRARGAPQLLTPGLLASSIPGGAAYAGLTSASAAAPDAAVTGSDAAVAASESGQIPAVSLGSAASLPARVATLARRHRLVVGDLPSGARGLAALRSILAARTSRQLVLVLQRSTDAASGALLWVAAAGLPGGATRELTSASTEQRGLIVSVDLAPTILAHLRVRAPAAMRGRAIATDDALDATGLRDTMARLRVLGGRRLKALAFLLLAIAALLTAASALAPERRARAIRVAALAPMWAPVAVLIPAALEPGAALEYLLISASCVILAALSDALLAWPRATLAPAAAAVLLLSADALAHTQLLVRSLLGPNPLLGARFYGIGNELKSALAVLVLAALAGALYPSQRDRRALGAMLGAGVLLAIVEGSARIGAGVGGVILVSAGFAVAAVVLVPGAFSRRRALVVMLAPVAGLVALAALDLASAHGSGHFTGSILHARSAGDLRDVLVRRYKAAWGELRNHTMPIATGLALLCGGFAIRRRDALLAPVAGDPAWEAALAGGLAAGVVGALVEDSGPVLLVVAVFTLGCLAGYLLGAPPLSVRSPDTPRGSRSHARTRPAEHAR